MLFTTPYERLTAGRLPWLSLGFAALLLLVFFVAGAWPEPFASLPLRPDRVDAGTLAGHWLLHESWAQLATVLLLVLVAGPVLEEAWGRLFYAGFLGVMLLGSSGAYVLVQSGSPRPLVGASGLAAALLGACLARQLRDGIHYTAVAWWQGPVHTRFWIPAYALLGLWFAGEVLMQIVDDGQGPTRGLGYAGQAAGALLGAVTARSLLRLDLERRWLRRRPLSDTHPALEAAAAAFEASGADAAVRILRPAVELVPDDPALVGALCRACCAACEPEVAHRPFVELIRAMLRGGRALEAADLWAEWAKPLGSPALESRACLQLAEALVARSHGVAAARLLRRLLETPQQLSTGAALRIVELARPVHAGIAIRAAHLALEGGDFPDPKRRRIEGVLRELEARRALELDPELDDPRPRDAGDRSIEIASEDELHRPPPGAEVAAETIAERSSFELNPDGSLVGTGSDFELAAPEVDTDVMLAVGLDTAATQTRFSDAKCVEVVPLAWEGARLLLERGDATSAWLELAQVQAVASAAVRGMAERPVVVIDLLMNWSVVEEVPLAVLRLRSDRFDPTALLPGAGPGLDAFRAMLGGLIEQSGGAPLPDAERAEGRPFAMFETLEAYEREVLLLER